VLRYPDGGHLSGDLPPGAIYTDATFADYGGTVAAAQRSSDAPDVRSVLAPSRRGSGGPDGSPTSRRSRLCESSSG
jgi:hypothetical protein